jgi:hypothetical protein
MFSRSDLYAVLFVTLYQREGYGLSPYIQRNPRLTLRYANLPIRYV